MKISNIADNSIDRDFLTLNKALEKLPENIEVKCFPEETFLNLPPAQQYIQLVLLKEQLREILNTTPEKEICFKLAIIDEEINHLLKQDHFSSEVPKIMHFVWIGKVNQVQIDYIQLLKLSNPNYQVKVWHDPEAYLVKTLNDRIKTFSEKTYNTPIERDKRYLNAVKRLQNEFFKFNQCFKSRALDQNINDWLVQKRVCRNTGISCYLQRK